MITTAYVNGQFVAGNHTVPMNDLGLLRGYAVFDFCRTINGKPFLLNQYLTRFRRSAALLGLALHDSDEKLAEVIHQLVQQSGLSNAGIRLLLTGGYTPDGITPVMPNLMIFIEPLTSTSDAVMQTGIRVMSYEYQRDLPEIKTTNYLVALKLRSEQLARGAQDILYYHQDNLLELTRNNLFIVRDNTLITPDAHILFGITRQTVIDLAKAQYRVEVREVKVEELWEADEVFSTGTNKKLVPIIQVDDQVIGNGKVGFVTKNLYQSFMDFEQESIRK